jgi:hypothetical protein
MILCRMGTMPSAMPPNDSNECLDAVLPLLVETLKRYADTEIWVTETREVRKSITM